MFSICSLFLILPTKIITLHLPEYYYFGAIHFAIQNVLSPGSTFYTCPMPSLSWDCVSMRHEGRGMTTSTVIVVWAPCGIQGWLRIILHLCCSLCSFSSLLPRWLSSSSWVLVDKSWGRRPFRDWQVCFYFFLNFYYSTKSSTPQLSLSHRPAPVGSAGFCLSVAMGQARIFPRGGKKHPVKAFFSADLSSMAYLVVNFSSHHDPNSFCLHGRFRNFKRSVSSTRPNNSSLCFYGISGVGFGEDYGFHYFLRTQSET